MARFHTAAGSDITVYLEAVDDPKDLSASGIPFDRLLTKIAVDWGQIANAMSLRLIFVPGPNTVLLDSSIPSPPGTALVDNAGPTDRILYSDKVIQPPTGVKFFKLLIGNGASATIESQSTQTSYVTYSKGSGYIYVLKGKVPHISHELGHILGLTDRYYEGMAWDFKHVIKRTCKQVRNGEWFLSDGTDQRDPIVDKNNAATNNLPHYAERVSLIMHQRAVPDDTDYAPGDNLMSSLNATLTHYQLDLIGITEDGQNKTPEVEKDIRKTNWIAILGEEHSPNFKQFYVWEETDRDNKGLKYYPDNDQTKDPKSYPCWSRQKGRALEKGSVVQPTLITELMGKKDSWLLDLKTFLKPTHYDLVRKTFPKRNNRMCYAKRVITDLA